jgi:hypothetical protein
MAVARYAATAAMTKINERGTGANDERSHAGTVMSERKPDARPALADASRWTGSSMFDPEPLENITPKIP